MNSRIFIALLWSCFVVSSCTRADRDQACTSRLEQLEAKLSALKRVSHVDWFGSKVTVAPLVAKSRRVDDLGPLVEIGAGEVWLDQRKLGRVADADTRGAVERDLSTLDRNYAILHPDARGPSGPVYVLAAADVGVQELLQVVSAFPRPEVARLVVRHSPTPGIDPVPKGASLRLRNEVKAIQALARDSRTPRLVDLVVSGRGSCKALDALYGQVAVSDADTKDDILIEGLVPSLRRCRCQDVDVDALEASTVLLLSPEGPPTGWLPLLTAPTQANNAPPLALARDATVKELAADLERAEHSGQTLYLPSFQHGPRTSAGRIPVDP